MNYIFRNKISRIKEFKVNAVPALCEVYTMCTKHENIIQGAEKTFLRGVRRCIILTIWRIKT